MPARTLRIRIKLIHHPLQHTPTPSKTNKRIKLITQKILQKHHPRIRDRYTQLQYQMLDARMHLVYPAEDLLVLVRGADLRELAFRAAVEH